VSHMRACPSLGFCVFSPEGYSGVGGVGCRAARTSAGSFPGYGRENALRRGRTRERQGPSPVWVAPCAAQQVAPPSVRGRAAPQEDHPHEGVCLMQIVRVYTGADGESHFEDLTPEQLAQIVNNVGKGPITLNCRPSPSFSDYHQAPRRQYVVNLSGVAEFETADGSTRRLFPGDVLVAEGLPGHGHIARSIGEEFRVSLAIPLAEGQG